MPRVITTVYHQDIRKAVADIKETNLRSLPIYDTNSHSSPLGFILCEFGKSIVGFEVLDLLEV